ncbi:4-(cytidine 5'-diphospho)-2-C-methyl-D-erythritol kinase [Sphingomonas panacisoli]|uniref:4-diphosphocytidyl-2-C-methyl-D-erythritol kinase n=1 Tax=Sphingomonas panacisoli TaxID=1813879 RepID=A0A5B8LKH7_9SPHN|nr:4-(cytidine 5'-diphospho)-2-C-methyl-D-erythritol kinase [Sphingomonas panacisoli]QDZ07590.1 4-(cytidine 5'-diphospho)-2-C-methyl-D-erythritol kinase [Sphingomonas panacisoli]
MITEPAPAKINLALHVRARRPDGYHEIETLFAFCRDGDAVTITEAEQDSFAVSGPFASALSGEGNNLVIAARDAFAATFGPLPSLAITLDKHLPVASGIGGGSADAAATLRALGRLQGVAIDDMFDVALSLGSDVPACLLSRSAIGGGRGEKLTPIDGLADTPVLLVNPRVAVSTAKVFAGWDGVDRGALGEIADSRNDLEPPARQLAPAIGAVLSKLAEQSGVTLARMSGSGATCFALFDNAAARWAAHAAIAAMHPDWWYLESTLA